MPLRFGRALVLAGIGCVAVYFLWFVLGAFLWWPFWRQLARYGLIVEDFGGAFLLVYGPFVAAAIFLASLSAEAWFERRAFESGRPPPSDTGRILWLGVLPAAITFALINGPHRDSWYFPLSETAVGLVGFGLGYLWVRWRRTDEARYSSAS